MIVLSNPCTLTAPSNPAAYTYSIDTPAYTWTVAAYYSNSNCIATETLTLQKSDGAATPSWGTAPSWISVSSRTITVYTTDTSLHGTSATLRVTSTLSNVAATSNTSYTFTITLNNPCVLTAPSNPASYTYYVDNGTTGAARTYSWTVAAYKPSECTYIETLSISPSNLSWITLSSRTISVMTTDISFVGTTTFTVTSTLSNTSSSTNSSY